MLTNSINLGIARHLLFLDISRDNDYRQVGNRTDEDYLFELIVKSTAVATHYSNAMLQNNSNISINKYNQHILTTYLCLRWYILGRKRQNNEQ